MSAFMANEKTCVGAQVFSGLRITLTGNSQPTVYHDCGISTTIILCDILVITSFGSVSGL